MTVPVRQPIGQKTVTAVGANLFILAAQELGDATAWDRISDLNGGPGDPPDFLLPGQQALVIPAARRAAGKPAPTTSIETQLFGAAA